MMKHLGLFLTTLMFVSSVWAAGTITLKGTLRSFSSSSVELYDGKNVYSLDKKQLSKSQLATIKSLKVGDKTEMSVKFTAILSAKKL